MDISLDNLVFETTRRCNMHCPHCLRGDAQNRDITEAVIDAALSEINSIAILTLTGGEPTLNVPAIRYIAKRVAELGIFLGHAFIATNGKEVGFDFLAACLELFSLAQEPEMNGLALSADDFHEEISAENLKRLELLSAFTSPGKKADSTKSPLLNLGRARNLNGYMKMEKEYVKGWAECDDDSIFIGTTLAVTVDGAILTDSDYEYAGTDKICVGNVFDPNWVQQIAEKFNNGTEV